MPAIITHEMFGEKMLEGPCENLFSTVDERNSFLLGNQGPDPFFYRFFTPKVIETSNLARKMHNSNTVAQFDAMRNFAWHAAPSHQGVMKAFTFGFICHFALDSTTHPFIFATQHAICDAGVKGLDRSAGHEVHNQIEADLDAMMLWRIKGVDIASYAPHREILKADDETLQTIDRLVRYTVAGAQQTVIPEGEYAKAVEDFRFLRHGLYSPTGVSRAIAGAGERLFRKHSAAQAMSTRATVHADCAFSNSAHMPWSDPATGEVSTQSFLDLFDTALAIAADDIRLAREGAPSEEIARSVNFSGVPIEG